MEGIRNKVHVEILNDALNKYRETWNHVQRMNENRIHRQTVDHHRQEIGRSRRPTRGWQGET
jgi:hypothetical protein